MKNVPVVIAASALYTVLSAQASAAIHNITGSAINPPPQGPAVITYVGGNPTFTGTYDDVANTLTYVWDNTWVTNISVFNGTYVGDVTTQNNGSVAASTSPLPGAITNTNTVTCVGSKLVCGASGGATTLSGFTFNGTGGTFQQSTATSNGPALTNYTFGVAPPTPTPTPTATPTPTPTPPPRPPRPVDPNAIPVMPLSGLVMTGVALVFLARRRLRSALTK